MLDRVDAATRVPAERIREFCERALAAVGATAEEASAVARILVDADLRGIDTHGVVRLPLYVARARGGGIQPGSQIEIITDHGQIVVIDGRAGFGHFVAAKAMSVVLERAARYGMAAAAVRNSNHLGALSYYSRMALDRSAIGIAVSGAGPNIAPWGGAEAVLATNPWSIALPAGRHGPIVVDVSNGAVLSGKIKEALDRSEKIPLGWGLDGEGRPTEDPRAVKSMMPFGGAKGAALTLALEILTSVLTGGIYGKNGVDPGKTDRAQGLGHLFIVLQIDRFLPVDEYEARVDDLIDMLKTSRPKSGSSGIRLPGERGALTFAERSREGVPLSTARRHELDALAHDLRVAPLDSG